MASGADFDNCVENIDIGGPAMIRSAAKNHAYVCVCTEPQQVADVVVALKADGVTTLELRKRLAARAYARTAAYDAAIAGWFGTEIQDWFPPIFTFGGGRIQTMRYGENPHQHAAFYRGGEDRPASPPPAWSRARNFPTTTWPTPMPPSSSWPSSIRPIRRRSPSSSTPIPAASPKART